MTENKPIPKVGSGKVLLFDYDSILNYSDDECCYSLSEKEVHILRAQLDPISWARRWVSVSDQTIDLDNLLKWQGNLARKLMSGCCGDEVVLHRVTDDGAMEVSTDGGATWVPDPADPRVNGTALPNTIPGTGDNKKCNGATNAIGNFKDAQAAFATSLTTTTTVIGLALAIAGELLILLFSAGTTAEVIVPLVISTATALFGVLEADYNAEFTEAVWDKLTCDILCTIGDDGQFTESQLIDLEARVDTDFSDNVALTFQSILRGWGTRGLNNACIAGSATAADCGDCDCELDCGDGWEVLEGTYLGQFGLYHRYQSADTSGTQTIYIRKSDDPDNCCKLLDARFVSGEEFFAAAYHKICGGGSLDSGWGLEGCYWTLAGQTLTGHAENTFVVEFYWGDCE